MCFSAVGTAGPAGAGADRDYINIQDGNATRDYVNLGGGGLGGGPSMASCSASNAARGFALTSAGEIPDAWSAVSHVAGSPARVA